MPDRYGDRPDPELGDPDDEPATPEDFGPTPAELRALAIQACSLCDPDGYTPALTVCDHIDHRDTNRRGIQQIRQAMGWNSTPPPNHP